MTRRPLLLWIVGFGLILSPVFYYLQDGIGPELLDQPLLVAKRMTTLKLIGVLLGPIVGALILTVRRVGWFAMIGYAVYTMFANFMMYQDGKLRSTSLLLANATGLAAILYFTRREIMSPYFSPRLRWWERQPRETIKLRVEIAGKKTIVCETFDISASGCFLLTDDDLSAGEELAMKMHIGDDKPVEVNGTVMWVSDGTKRPRGVGVKFARTPRDLKVAIKSLKGREAA